MAACGPGEIPVRAARGARSTARVRDGSHVRATLGRAGVLRTGSRRPLGCRDVETPGWTDGVSAARPDDHDTRWVGVCEKTADRSLKMCASDRFPSRTLRPDCLAATRSTKHERGQRPSRWLAFEVVQVSLPVVGKLRLNGLRRFPPAVSPFPVAAPGLPYRRMLECFHMNIRLPAFTSRSARPIGTGPPDTRRPQASAEHHTVLPSSDSILRGPLLRHLQRSTPEAPEGTPSDRGCHTTASRSALVVSHHLGGFLRAAGPGLVASRYRTWGSLRFTYAKRQVYEAPTAGGWTTPTPKGGADRILAAMTLRRFAPRRQPHRVTAAVALLPLFSSRHTTEVA